ncbi:MAG TPA: hypothetical protein VJO12_08550 [Stellaceae bacterium]|nr:hypothetical protein [Stellaceae bacterium]
MARLVNNRRMMGAALAGSLVFAVAFAAPARADSAGNAYAFADRVVFDTVVTDPATSRSTRLLNVVSLDDKVALRVVGKVAMPGQSAYVGAYGNRNDKLIVLLWDRVEIYDLADAAKPRFVQSLPLGDQGFSSPGHPRVEAAGEGKFLLLNPRNTTELTTAGEGLEWHIRALAPPTPEQKARMVAPPPDRLPSDEGPPALPRLLRESDRFRYELVWIDKRRTGEIVHRKYVRQIDKASGRTASALLLHTAIETID